MSNYAENLLFKTTQWPRRKLIIDSVSQATLRNVWYYRINVSAYEEVRLSTFIDEDVSDNSSSDDDRSSDASTITTSVKHYSILRRYSDFLLLFEQVRDVVAATEGNKAVLPTFPAKEFISPTLKGILQRSSSTKAVLDDRSLKFQVLLEWIENHPNIRTCHAFIKFIGKPPQSHDGYISLKEYTPSDWLLSLQQTTKSMESCGRRYSIESSGIKFRQERPNFDVSGGLTRFRFEHFHSTKKAASNMQGMPTALEESYDQLDRYSV
ncbi:unnamed protein product [Peronospora belbahrii]|uniref:PX domain-containing protein n=1 Tax=Peronospora belbahrii TaxID=622444 RepID=A0AAU9LCM0_9STRA|nr:unnamed protein product [Peronospora belbahrii]CAH0516726.1 unnamed protein product [Peronospora belbahrii]